jgi:RNA polymerase sigma-70 factor (ECF subfamily)
MTSTSHFTGWVSDLARRHARDLAAVARREGLSSDDALDAVQEAFHSFLVIPQARMIVEDGDDSRKLLTVLVRNAARNMRRRHHRARPHDDVDAVGLAGELPPVDEVLARAEEHVALLGCMHRLADIQRRVVSLRMLDELSGPEVATELGLTAGHVAVLLHRAKHDLLVCMA